MYKGQGRIQRAMVTRAYEAFRVHDEQLQASIPVRTRIVVSTASFRIRNEHIILAIVARVRPRDI